MMTRRSCSEAPPKSSLGHHGFPSQKLGVGWGGGNNFLNIHEKNRNKSSDTCLPIEEGNGTLLSTLAWKIPWTEEPGRLQSMGSLRVGHD